MFPLPPNGHAPSPPLSGYRPECLPQSVSVSLLSCCLHTLYSILGPRNHLYRLRSTTVAYKRLILRHRFNKLISALRAEKATRKFFYFDPGPFSHASAADCIKIVLDPLLFKVAELSNFKQNLAYLCHPVPAGISKDYLQNLMGNSQLMHTPSLPSYCLSIPARDTPKIYYPCVAQRSQAFGGTAGTGSAAAIHHHQTVLWN